jgi:AraC-like DNA-binding protein
MLVCVNHMSGQRHWTVADGLPTGEVQQIVELPNGQMLVNCEGVFCLSNGRSFDVVPCDQSRAYQLPRYTNRYGLLWEGDSVLWLHDFYRIFCFDARQRIFVNDTRNRLNDNLQKDILSDKANTPQPTLSQRSIIDSLHIGDITLAINDRQGGVWIGTRSSGIYYQPPHRAKPEIHTGNDPLIGMARSASLRSGQTTFVLELPDGRQLRCDSLCQLGYYLPEQQTTISLNDKFPALNKYRHMVGACPLDADWVAVYTQNGMFMLNTKTDTLASFPYANEIERYSSKYNCMLKDKDGMLWIGTQNGLFVTNPSKPSITRVSGLSNDCVRSLVLDDKGHVWAGTSYGVSRVTPTVVNLGTDDGIPAISMMDRAACLTDDGLLVFAVGGGMAVAFRPDDLIGKEKPLPVVLTRMEVNGEHVQKLPHSLPYTQNYLTFQFSTLNYATPSHDRYRYRLRGLEREWNICSDGGGLCIAEYKALPPGNYTFEVQAATASGEWGSVTKQTFVICQPWWLTWWAKTIYCCLVLTIAGRLIALYLKKKKAKMEHENDQRVNRLFELREEARHQFAESANIAPDKITINAEEEKMVSQMLKAIEAHIDDEQYNADQLARDIAMSRASLYKKMQTILGITPTDFIRNVRLKRAAQLLADTQLSINEIASRVGFVTARNFSSQFKKMFGVTPSEYRDPPKNLE